ncbi:MAG: HDOD domain-containing protein [Gammaproteobacteria bacterium]|nr:HDOD domain-containing protein [Gammaproteobacteria bacterium]
MVFKSDTASSGQHDDETAALLLSSAASVSPVNELSAQNRAALCKTANLSHMQRNDRLKPENTHRWLMYLVEGSLTLYNGKDEVGTLSARTTEAQQPLFMDKSYQTLKATSMVKIARFGREQLDILTRDQQKNAIHVEDVEVDELDNLLFDEIIADLPKNRISLASFGENSAKILGMLGSNAGIPEMADAIQADPGLSAHIVLAANRKEGVSGDAIQTIRGAISRLGVEATVQNTQELLRANTMIPANDAIDDRFRRYVKRSGLASAIAYVLAKELPHLKADMAMLIALMSDIGELMVISYANKHATRFEQSADLANTINNLRGICSSWLLSTWDFSEEFIHSSETARQWYRNHTGEISYSDLVTAALLIIQSEQPDSEKSSIPSADNLLLARRLQQAGIDIKSPGEIVREATTRLGGQSGLLKAS